MSDPIVRDVDQMLDRWIDAVAPERAPTSLLEGTFARTMTTSQARPVPWRQIRIGPRPKAAFAPLAWVAVIVILAVAIAAVALLRAVAARHSSPSSPRARRDRRRDDEPEPAGVAIWPTANLGDARGDDRRREPAVHGDGRDCPMADQPGGRGRPHRPRREHDRRLEAGSDRRAIRTRASRRMRMPCGSPIGLRVTASVSIPATLEATTTTTAVCVQGRHRGGTRRLVGGHARWRGACESIRRAT